MKLEDLISKDLLNELALDVLCDTQVCREIGIKYGNIDASDIEKARQYVRRFYQLQDAGGNGEYYKS